MKPKAELRFEIPKSEKPQKPEVSIQRSEFWSKKEIKYTGDGIFQLLDELATAHSQPDYQRNRNQEVIESYREYANWIVDGTKRILAVPYSERRRMPLPPRDLGLLSDEQIRQLRNDACSVLAHATNLERAIQNGDIHFSVDAALRLQREWERLLVRRHESNAELGRKKRVSLSLGGKKRQEGAAQEIAKQKKRIVAMYKNFLNADYDKHEIPAKIAERLNIDISTVHRCLRPAKKRLPA